MNCIARRTFWKRYRFVRGALRLLDKHQVLNGRALRSLMGREGKMLGTVDFYHLMGLLENREIVRGWYQEVLIDGRVVHVRMYFNRRKRPDTVDWIARLTGGEPQTKEETK